MAGWMNYKACLTEFFATFLFTVLFTFRGTTVEGFGPGGYEFGIIGGALAIFVISSAVGDISGAHMNPMISLALAVSGNMGKLECAVYIAVQTFGAILGVMTRILMRGFEDTESFLTLERESGDVETAWPGFVADTSTVQPHFEISNPKLHFQAPLFKYLSGRTLLGVDSASTTGRSLLADSTDNLASREGGDLAIEFMGCVLYLFILLNMGMSNKNSSSPLAYAMAFFASAAGVCALGGAISLNPARAFASAIFETYSREGDYAAYADPQSSPAMRDRDFVYDAANDIDNVAIGWWNRADGGRALYVWLVGPFLAAFAAPIIYKLVRGTCKSGMRVGGFHESGVPLS